MNKIFLSLLLLVPVLSFVPIANANSHDIPRDIQGLAEVLERIGNILAQLLIVLSVIFVVFAGYKYLTASGSPEKVKEANKQILYAAVAIIIAILAWSLPQIIDDVLGTDYIN